MELVTPSTLSRHKQSWQRRCRRCLTRAKDAFHSWGEAQSAGLAAGNALVNDLVLLKALAASPTVHELDENSKDSHANLRGLRAASLAKVRERILRQSTDVEQAFSGLSQALELLREGEKALKEEDSISVSLALDPAVSKKLQTQQPVYWSVTPSAYLSKVRKVVECYEREILVKKHVFTFLSQLARDAQSETFHKEAMTEQLESQMKVQLVVWMLEPEIDAESVQDLENLYQVENKLCKRY